MKQEIYEQLKKISERLKKEYQAKDVILFGSYVTGKATDDSDVDLLIIAPTNERFFERMAKVRGLIRNLRKGLAVSPVVLTDHELRKRVRIGDQFIKEILEKGIRL